HIPTPSKEKDATGTKFLDAVVVAIHYVYVAGAVNIHVTGSIELHLATAIAAPCGQKITTATELLNAVVGAVGHIDIADRVDGHAHRRVELPVAATGDAWSATVSRGTDLETRPDVAADDVPAPGQQEIPGSV